MSPCCDLDLEDNNNKKCPHDPSSWCCITILNLVTKCPVIQKILLRQTFTVISNLRFDLDFEQKDLFAIFKVKVTARAHVIKIWQFLLYLLNCWSFCYQTWFDSKLSLARVFYGETGSLCSRSRSQQNSKMSMNVCPHNIFWIAVPFTTKLGMVLGCTSIIGVPLGQMSELHRSDRTFVLFTAKWIRHFSTGHSGFWCCTI